MMIIVAFKIVRFDSAQVEWCDSAQVEYDSAQVELGQGVVTR